MEEKGRLDQILSNDSQSSDTQADILIVDDVLENIRLLSNLLNQSGYITRKATSGPMALSSIEAAVPALVLLDVNMPEMSGYEVCRHLKANPATANIPVIFLSAAGNVMDKVQAFQVGGADYITKPFHVEEVLARVQHQLELLKARQMIVQLNSQLEERVKERTLQLEIANAQLAQMAFHDPLTGLPNRTLLMQCLRDAIQKVQKNSAYQFSLLYLDCDRFKIINDSLGHQAGDELLIQIAQRLQSILCAEDLVARLGGDEFVVMLPDLSDLQVAIQVAEKILSDFALPFHFKERDIFIPFSIGIVLDCSTYQDPEALLRDADIAMYQAKFSGKERYQIFTPSMYKTVCDRLQLETDLRKALQNEEFELHYQPIVELKTGTAVGVEALIRWRHPTLGLVSPDLFIPLAEETGLITKLGYWALKEACSQLYVWQQQGIVSPTFSVSVNISAYQFVQPELVQQIDEVLASTQIPPQCLKLEITETVIMQNVASVAAIMRDLRQRQIQLSIDDFGTGYSSLSYLHSFPVDNLKIDRSFINNLQVSSNSLGLMSAILLIAKTMEMSLIAEGIETQEQLDLLISLECQLGQGYFFSKPLPADVISKVLTQESLPVSA